MPIEEHFESTVAARMRTELQRFADKCHYDEDKRKIVYHSDQCAMEAYMAIQREEMERHKWLESEKRQQDAGKDALADWVTRFSSKFARYWKRTHAYIPNGSQENGKIAS
jgi:hypothetical protein